MSENIVEQIVNAWDCCGTCAGGVLARHDAEVEQAAEQRGREEVLAERDEAVADADYNAARASALKAKHEGGSGGWWAEWHRTHCAAAEAAHRAEAALAGLLAEVEALAEASLLDGRGGTWVLDEWFRAIVARHRDGGSSDG